MSERDQDQDRERRSEELIERMKAGRGYIYPEWELAARLDPDFMEVYNQVAGMVLLHQGVASEEGKALSAKYRELIPIAILAHRGQVEGVLTHMKRAIRLGATEQELWEAVQVCFIPGGAPAFYAGLKALLMLKEEKGGPV